MSSELDAVGADLEAYLKPLVPPKWRVQDALLPLGNTTVPVLTYAQGNVSAELNGILMPNGAVGVDFVLILSTPETDPVKGFAHLNREAPHLFRALDAHPQLTWTTAERGVLQSGESIYLIPVVVLATFALKE